MFRLHSNEPGPPCKHMEGYLNQAADGSAGALTKWYAFAHAVRCKRCEKYLRDLEAMIERLRHEREQDLAPSTRARLESALRKVAEAL
jgi:hypothetical protein